MAIGVLKDFTAYTETDPGADIVVDSATQITVTTIDNSPGGAYVYDNYGAGGIPDRFVLHGSFKITALSSTTTYFGLGGVSQNLAEWASTSHVNSLLFRTAAGTSSTVTRVHMRERAASVSYDAAGTVDLNVNTQYWWALRCYRSPGQTYGRAVLSIYSDSARTTKVEEVQLALHSNVTYQYMYACLSQGNTTGHTVSAVIYEQRFIPLTVNDFTTYTEQDTANDIQSIAASTFSIVSMANNADGYLVKDIGANAIGKFMLKTGWRLTAINAGTAPIVFLGGVSKNLGVHNSEQDGLHIQAGLTSGVNGTFKIVERVGGTEYSSTASASRNLSQYHDFELIVDPDVGTYGTAYLKSFTNGLQEDSLSLTLSASTSARYLYAVQAKGDATTDSQSGGLDVAQQLWYAAAAQTINASVTESISLVDTPSAVLNLPVAITESIALADTPSAVLDIPAVITENLALADSSSPIMLFVADITESLNLTDSSSTSGLIITGDVVESITLTESSSALGVFTATCVEVLSLADLQSAVAVYSVTASESLTLADFVSAEVIAGAPTIILSVDGFPTSAAGTVVQYRIEQSATGAIEQDWTASGVTENPIGDGKSVYRVATNRIMAGAQVTVLWRYSADSGATWSKYAQETLNILDTYVITIKQLVEALNLGSASVQLSDIHGRLALDASRPVTQSSTQISFGNVVLALGLDASGNGTVTRQP